MGEIYNKAKIFFRKDDESIDNRKYLNSFPLSVIRYPLSVILKSF
ncbi:hypothetical protein [Ignavibacterium sp.]